MARRRSSGRPRTMSRRARRRCPAGGNLAATLEAIRPCARHAGGGTSPPCPDRGCGPAPDNGSAPNRLGLTNGPARATRPGTLIRALLDARRAMAIRVYNSLTRKKEPFTPLHGNRVSMFVCGLTPQDETHMGHAKTYVAFDVVARYLRHKGFHVFYLQNVTDI